MFPPNRIAFNSTHEKINIFDSKVSFVNIILAHGLETKETRTGPTVVVGATIYIITIIVYDTCTAIYSCTAVLSVFNWCQ